MKTYLAYDNNYYKIGKSKNPIKRIQKLKTANPSIRLICYGEGDKEAFLHKRYDKNRVAREWFDLDEDQIKDIKEVLNERVGKLTDLKRVLDFGKYKGLQLAELRSYSHKNYMQWYIRNSKYSDNWHQLFKRQLKRIEKIDILFKTKNKKRIRNKRKK